MTKTTLMLVLSFLFLISCGEKKEIKDIIPPIKLTAGSEKSVLISDLYFADNYNVKIKENKNVQAEYNAEKKILKIKSNDNFEGVTLLDFETDMNVYSIPVFSSKEQLYKFSFKPNKKYKKLNLFGNFNGWNRTELPMKDEDGDGIFSAKVALDPGVYQYKFFADGKEILDKENPNKISNGMGSFNSVRTIEDPNSEKFYLHIDKYESKAPKSSFLFIIEDELKAELKYGNIFALLNNKKVAKEKISLEGNYISITFNYDELTNQTLRVFVSKNGRISNIQTIELENGKPVNNNSFSWKDGIIYSLMVDRFYDGNKENNTKVKHDSLSDKANYKGGDLKGIIDKLDEGYFNKLGINVLWISPVIDNPNEAYKEYPAPHRYYSGYHGYWPTSDKKVEEHFGTMEDVKTVVKKAHENGIKVLLDFVSNHVHKEHPYFKEHRDWFGKLELPDGKLNLRKWDEYRLTTWFEPYIPSFDYLGSEEALEAMTSLAVWWLNETGADGYRHDAVKHVPNKFWRRLNEKIQKEVASKRDLPVYQIGETFGSYELINSYVNNGQLSSQFNFNLYDSALPTFTNKDASFSTLDKEMKKTFSVYGVNHLMGNIMDSHDKNRFMAFADKDLDPSQWSAIEQGWNNPPKVDNPQNYKKLILYMAYMNSIPGIPVIYYGSEFGMSGASDPDNRRMMRFDDELSEPEKNTLKEVSEIIKLRKNHSALRQGDFYTLVADKNIYAYIRSDMNERILVVLNKDDNKQKVNLVLPKFLAIISAENLSNNNIVKVQNNYLNTELDEMSWKIFKLKH